MPAFHNLNANGILAAVVKGQRPTQDQYPNLQDNLWKLLTECWAEDPLVRPNAQELLERVKQALAAELNAPTLTLADIESLMMDPANASLEKVTKQPVRCFLAFSLRL